MTKNSFELSDISYLVSLQDSFRNVIVGYSGLNDKFLTSDEILFSLDALKCNSMLSRIYVNMNLNNGELDFEHLKEFALYLSHLDTKNTLVSDSLKGFLVNIGLSENSVSKLFHMIDSKSKHYDKLGNLKKSIISLILGDEFRYLTNSVIEGKFVRSDLSKIYDDVNIAFDSYVAHIGLILLDSIYFNDLKQSLVDKKWPLSIVESSTLEIKSILEYQLNLCHNYLSLHKNIESGKYHPDMLTNLDVDESLKNQLSYHLAKSNLSNSNYSLDVGISESYSNDVESHYDLLNPIFRNK